MLSPDVDRFLLWLSLPSALESDAGGLSNSHVSLAYGESGMQMDLIVFAG
jgi:hypothetical protein